MRIYRKKYQVTIVSKRDHCVMSSWEGTWQMACLIGTPTDPSLTLHSTISASLVWTTRLDGGEVLIPAKASSQLTTCTSRWINTADSMPLPTVTQVCVIHWFPGSSAVLCPTNSSQVLLASFYCPFFTGLFFRSSIKYGFSSRLWPASRDPNRGEVKATEESFLILNLSDLLSGVDKAWGLTSGVATRKCEV